MDLISYDDKPRFDKPWMKDYGFHLVDSIGKLKKLVDICIERKVASFDTETTGLDTRVYPDGYFEDGKKTRNGLRTIITCVGVCISFDGVNGYYIPLAHEPEGSNNLPWDLAWDELTRLANNCRLIFHNAKYDHEVVYPLVGKEYWKVDEYEDTMFMAKIINPLKTHPSGLKQLSKAYFGVDMIELEDLFTPEMRASLKRQGKSSLNFAALHPKEGLEYGASDGIFTYKLYHSMIEKLSDGDKKIYNLEKSFCNVMRKMERNRIHVDVDMVMKLSAECDNELLAVGDAIRDHIEAKTKRTGKWLNLNVGSPSQLSKALLTDPEGLRLKPTKLMIDLAAEDGGSGGEEEDDGDSDDASGQIGAVKQWSLKDEALKSLHEAYGSMNAIDRGHKDKDGNPKKESIFELIIEWRHYLKMKGSYMEPLSQAVDKNGDVRPNFRQIGTDTTRLASSAGDIADGYSGINFQGIPRDSDDDKPELFKAIRSCIIPRKGFFLVKLDFAGEELRVVTNLSGDPIWTDSFVNKDGDVHKITAKTLFGKDDVTKDERNRGKRCNFAFIYGGGAGAIQRNIGCSIEEASRHMENLKRDVPVLMGYVDHQKSFAKKHKCIYTAYGRRIPIPNIDSPIRGLKAKAERQAINYTIQGTAADIIKFAMCYVDKQIRAHGWEEKCRYVLTVHDEVVYEITPDILQEAVRKLDEWMTVCWKLPKAHGREWVVPLLTEPGIDINWKARYDFFKMVDGVPVEAKQIDESGKYTGKVKKGEYYHNGKIYQEIPEWLKAHIKRGDQLVEPTKEAISEKQNHAAMEAASSTVTRAAAPVEPVDEEIELEKPEEIEFDYSDPEGANNEEISSPTPVIPDTIKKPSETTIAAPKASINTTEIKRVEPDPELYRLVWKAEFNERNMRKLNACAILAEGNTPLRIVSTDGRVLVPESDAPTVNVSEFSVICKLFGLD